MVEKVAMLCQEAHEGGFVAHSLLMLTAWIRCNSYNKLLIRIVKGLRFESVVLRCLDDVAQPDSPGAGNERGDFVAINWNSLFEQRHLLSTISRGPFLVNSVTDKEICEKDVRMSDE